MYLTKNYSHTLVIGSTGSGKTTSIRKQLKAILLEDPTARILCITYTNRATEELGKDLDKTNITICTIHSYINELISPFYKAKAIVELYWSIFNSRIVERIENKNADPNVTDSNNHYIEKFGALDVNTVKENLTEISYGETPFTSLYYGRLSHDDLLLFAYLAIERYPNILRKIGDKFDYIFIDDIQFFSFDEVIEFLETHADDLAGAGDVATADTFSDIIKFLEDEKQIHIPKIVIDEGDHYRCPSCGKSLGYKVGRCYECGQRIGV